MRVLHIISSGGMYGAEAVILNMSRILNDSSNHVALGVFSNSRNPNLQLHERAEKEGIESHLIHCEGQIDRKVISTIRELRERTSADVVHAHGYKADVYVYFAMRGGNTPFVSTCHNWINVSPLVSFYGMVDRIALRSYQGVVAVSEEVKQTLLKAGVSREKIRLIRNGVDLRPYDMANPSLDGTKAMNRGLRVGWVGRLSHEKGPDIFLRAAAKTLSVCPDTRFFLIGDGPNSEKLMALIDHLNIRENVSMLGRQDNMPGIYASLDLMVSSSRQEGLPMAILEGMASRLPWVATVVGDVPTLVIEGNTGLLAPVEDVERLATGITQLLCDSTLRKRMGEAGRMVIESRFSAARMTADYLSLYKDVVAERAFARDKGRRMIGGTE